MLQPRTPSADPRHDLKKAVAEFFAFTFGLNRPVISAVVIACGMLAVLLLLGALIR